MSFSEVISYLSEKTNANVDIVSSSTLEVRSENLTIRVSTEKGLEDTWWVDSNLVTQSPKIIASKLVNKLKLSERVHARKCEVRRIDKRTMECFLEEHHLNGVAGAKYKFGLYMDDQLMALVSFAAPRNINGKKSAELVRYCVHSFYSIPGGLDKLLQFYLKEYPCDDIFTYVDSSWSSGKGFMKVGFELEGVKELKSKQMLRLRKTIDRNSSHPHT